MDLIACITFDEDGFRRDMRSCSLNELESVEKALRQEIAQTGRAVGNDDPAYAGSGWAAWGSLTGKLGLCQRKLELVQEEWKRRGYTKDSSYFGDVAVPFLLGLFSEAMKGK